MGKRKKEGIYMEISYYSSYNFNNRYNIWEKNELIL